MINRDHDFDRADSLLELMSDGSNKDNTRASIKRSRAQMAIEQGDSERAYVYSKQVDDAADRVDLLASITRLQIRNGNIERAKAVWREAFQTANRVQFAVMQVHHMLKLIPVAFEINHALAFDGMKDVIEVINMSGLSAEQGGPSSGRDTKMSFFGRFDFDESFVLLASVDFEGVLRMAKNIKSKETSVWAQLAICKAVLQQPDHHRN